ncbi:DUF302 domain-containing protein [Kitasatospora aureofaciens]|uniref:DUF302 domain-containing protein n=1 Tax=Kitasatospora aureofaciens TaxID=1894 RepID=UPI000925C487|nr:DUF302 domain-containing protein [Streptomyces viridifaciens]UKZ04249.1 DUF302 domain-containing protein [Streptomyces viridifaciens]
MDYGISVWLDLPFADAVQRVRAALTEEGFGILTEIDIGATLKAKLGEEIEDYLILGACNPQLAYRALGVDRRIGLLLPCNVVVRSAAGGTVVEAMDPELMVQISDQTALTPVTDEAAARLRSALDALHE